MEDREFSPEKEQKECLKEQKVRVSKKKAQKLAYSVFEKVKYCKI